MLTQAQNERFTQVGPGTPMGDLFRRYWMPVATAAQLHSHPTKAVKVLGESLVLFRDRSGNYGLVQDACAHRNANLLWGIPEVEGLRCPYHGWMYDTTGQCVDQPAEAPDSTFKHKVQIKAYPVEELGGMLWAWLGPEPRPLVPHWEAMVQPNVVRDIGWAVLPCNWLQIMENSLDPVHVEWLHQYFSNYALERLGRGSENDSGYWRTEALVRRHVKIGFDVFEHGIVKRRVLEGDDETHSNWANGHVICFPNMLRQDQIRVPIDDTHTLYWWYKTYPKRAGDPDQAPEEIPLYKVPLPGVDEDGLPIWEVMDNNGGQDNYAWQSQGPGHAALDGDARRVRQGHHPLPQTAARADGHRRGRRRPDEHVPRPRDQRLGPRPARERRPELPGAVRRGAPTPAGGGRHRDGTVGEVQPHRATAGARGWVRHAERDREAGRRRRPDRPALVRPARAEETQRERRTPLGRRPGDAFGRERGRCAARR